MALAVDAERTGVLLVGGRSSRLGRPKALLDVGGQTLLERIGRRLLAVCDELVVVAAPPGARDVEEVGGVSRAIATLAATASRSRGRERPGLGTIRLVHDAAPDCGPVGGLAAGLGAARGALAFVTACDMPFIAPDLIEGLLTLAGSDFDVVVPRTSGGLEPLAAVYRRATMATHLAQQLAAGELRPTQRFAACRVREVGGAELARLDPEQRSFLGINDAADYERARLLAALSEPPPGATR